MLTIKFANHEDRKIWDMEQRETQKRKIRLKEERKERLLRNRRKTLREREEDASEKKTVRKRRVKVRPRVRFQDTEIGHFLLVYAPIEYHTLMQLKQTHKKKYAPFHVNEIETICMNSNNPAFRTVAFRKALVEYKEYDIRPKKKAKWTMGEILYYAQYSSIIHKEFKKCATKS